MRALTPLTAGLLVAGAMAGCGSDDGRAGPPAETVTYGSFGTRADIDCGDGKSLTVGGSNNTLTVTGRCGSVSVAGADNKITLEQVDDELSVAGLNNSITYRAGEPRVDDSGAGNRITQG
jgi:hypothetical protein